MGVEAIFNAGIKQLLRDIQYKYGMFLTGIGIVCGTFGKIMILISIYLRV